MLTFFSSSSTSSRFLRGSSFASRGFTLVELLITLAIVVIITAIIMVRFSSFESVTLLKGAAYEVALAIRDAQVYSVGVRQYDSGSPTTLFKSTYGVTFDPGEDTYSLFTYLGNGTPVFTDPSVSILTTYDFDNRMEISEVCVTTATGDQCGDAEGNGNLTRLDVSFRRPEFDSLFHAEGFLGTEAIISATVKIRSIRNPSAEWEIRIGALGHISLHDT